MERRKRAEDPPDVDHSDERTIDWKTATPRWLLVTALVVSAGGNGLLGSMLASSVSARLQQIEDKYSDPKWNALSDHAERIGLLESRVSQQAARVSKLEEADVRQQLLRLSYQVERLNARLEKKGF